MSLEVGSRGGLGGVGKIEKIFVRPRLMFCFATEPSTLSCLP